jgi:cell division septal protein FtsQ
MKKAGKSKWVVVFEGGLVVVWLVAMGLAGFFLPGFLAAVPVFEIKEVYVYGLRNVSVDAVSLGVYQLSKGSWLYLDERRLLVKVNELAGNAVEDVKVKRDFSLDGVRVSIHVKEREPVAYVVHDGKVLLMDGNGELFYNPAIERDLPTIYTFSLDYLKAQHAKLIGLIKAVGEMNEVYVAKDRTTIYTAGGKAVLPPLSKLSPLVLDRIKRLYSSIKEKQVEICMISEDIAVVKEKEGER